MLLYTYISRFSVNPHHQQREKIRQSYRHGSISSRFSTSPTNGPRSLSRAKAGTHSAFGEGSRTAAHTAKQGAFRTGGWYHYPRTVLRGSETLRGRASERRTLPLLGLGRVCARRTQKAFGTAMRLCVSLFRRRRGPAGLSDPVVRLLMLRFSVSVRKVSARFPANATRSSSHLNPSTTPPALLKESHTAAHTAKRVCP